MRELRPPERAALLIAISGILIGVFRGMARHSGDPDTISWDLALLVLGAALVGAVALGLKSGFFGGSDD
jgi:hypothetical protein